MLQENTADYQKLYNLIFEATKLNKISWRYVYSYYFVGKYDKVFDIDVFENYIIINYNSKDFLKIAIDTKELIELIEKNIGGGSSTLINLLIKLLENDISKSAK